MNAHDDNVTSNDIETHDEPDAAAQPAVEPLGPEEASGGERLDQRPGGAFATGFDPNAPRRISPLPVEAQTGVPDLTTGENEGVESQPEFASHVGEGVSSVPHSEANMTDNPGGE